MGHKPEGDPLKLIHILPSKPDSPRFRVQIGSERVPTWLAGLASIVRIYQLGTRRITSAIRWVGRQLLKGGRLAGISVRYLINRILRSGQIIRIPRLNFKVPMTKLLYVFSSMSEWINGLWPRRRNRRKKIPTLPKPLAQIAPPEEKPLINDVQTLQDQLLSQQQELTRVVTQMSELQALVLSQQQVLLHLGKELEAAEMRSKPQEPVVQRKPKTRTTKTSRSKKATSQKQPPPNPPLGMEVTG